MVEGEAQMGGMRGQIRGIRYSLAIGMNAIPIT
jgi:hypothetical protein